MTITPFTQSGTPPSRQDTPEVFNARVPAFLSWMSTFAAEINAQVDFLNAASDAAPAAIASANFKGSWSDLTGSLAIPASVEHNGAVWILTNNLGDVTASEPANGSPNWLPGVNIATALNIFAANAGKYLDAATLLEVNELVTLTDAATITPDLAAGRKFTVTLGGNRTLANPTNQAAGQEGLIIIKQDATGLRALAFGSDWKFAGGTVDASVDANAIDVLAYYVEAPGSILATYSGGFA